MNVLNPNKKIKYVKKEEILKNILRLLIGSIKLNVISSLRIPLWEAN